MTRDPLLDALRALARALVPHGVSLTIVGGFGLLLRSRMVAARGAPSLGTALADARSTSDIDCFLSADVITDGTKTAAVRAAIDAAGFIPRPNARYFQFYRDCEIDGQHREIGIDLLAAPVPAELRSRVRIKKPRIAPSDASGLHAFLTEEAFALQHAPHRLDIGDEGERIEVLLPHPFAFLILKLFAMRDRSLKTNDARQQYHAFDLYVIWAGMSPTEYDEVRSLARDLADHPVVREAASIVASHFANVSAVGAVALAEQAGGQALRDRNAFEQFMRDLRVFFEIAE